jgi:WD40 repeat protein
MFIESGKCFKEHFKSTTDKKLSPTIEIYLVVNGFWGHKFHVVLSRKRCLRKFVQFLLCVFSYPFEFSDTGTTLRCIKAFSNPINQLLFPFSNPKTFVASSTNQIKIYDLDSFAKRCEFTARDDAKIKLVKIIPHSDDRMFVVLNNDIICILTSTLKLIRHFEPLKARQKYLQKTNQKMEKLNYIRHPENDDDEMCSDVDVDVLIKSVTRDYQNGIITDVSFSLNGSCVCVSFLDNFIILFSTTMWDVRRVMKFPDEIYIKQSTFIPSTHEFNSNMLLTSTSNDDLMLMNLKDLNSKMLIGMNNSFSFTLSSNGKVLMNIQHSGEILVYNLEYCLNAVISVDDHGLKKNGELTKENKTKLTKLDGNEVTAELDKIQTKVIEKRHLHFTVHFSDVLASKSRAKI